MGSQGSSSLDELPVWVDRTDYHMCLTDVPDDEGEPRDLYALQTHQGQDSEDDKKDSEDGDLYDSPRSAPYDHDCTYSAGFYSGYDGRTDYELCLTDTPDDVSSDSGSDY